MILIRADGNEKTGAGHIMRCMTIGAKLAAAGEKVLFLCADETSSDYVRQQGGDACVLGTDYRDMESELPVWERLSNGWQTEYAKEAKDSPAETRPVILADSYYVTEGYLKELRRFGAVILMDDMGKRQYPVDAVVNYNVTANREVYRQLYRGTETKLFLGSCYVPLREQFLNRNYQVREVARKVMITAGGGDSGNIAGRLLWRLLDKRMEYHLVAGQFNPHYGTLQQMERKYENVHLHSNVTNMAELMMGADIVLTAGGSTIYELASLGVPFICFSCAENQEPLTEYIDTHKIAGFAGAFHKNAEAAVERVFSLFWNLASDKALREQYQRSEKGLVDGHGAERLASALAEIGSAAGRRREI